MSGGGCPPSISVICRGLRREFLRDFKLRFEGPQMTCTVVERWGFVPLVGCTMPLPSLKKESVEIFSLKIFFFFSMRNCLVDFSPMQVTRGLLGLIVITRYNDKTYRIDDVAWDKKPSSPWNDAGETYAQYSKRKYNINICNMTQPLLVSRLKVSNEFETRG